MGGHLVQMVGFGSRPHRQARLEDLPPTAEIQDVSVTDTAVDKRFTPACARLLHAILEELTSVVVEAAQDVPIRLLRRFSAVILEDSSSMTLPDALAEQWRGLWGHADAHGPAARRHCRC